MPLALVAALSGGVARAEDSAPDPSPNEHYSLRAELGPELDTNVHRTQTINVPDVPNVPIVSSPLARAVIAAALSDLVADGHQITMSATLAAKAFAKPEARSENVAVAESSLYWRMRLSPRSSLALAGAYYEAFQSPQPPPIYWSQRRDFRSILPTLRYAHALGEHGEVGFGAGYRWFVYKPDRASDFQAPSGFLDVRWAKETEDGAADWEVTARAGVERRAFQGNALVAGTNGGPVLIGNQQRIDEFLVGAVDVSRTGSVLVGGGYAMHVNASNSFGASAFRHYVSARFATELPLGLYLAARTELLVSAQYADAAAGRAYLTIEDENRSNVRAELSRNMTTTLQLTTRYTYYFNPFGGSATSYSRQTLLFSLVFALEK